MEACYRVERATVGTPLDREVPGQRVEEPGTDPLDIRRTEVRHPCRRQFPGEQRQLGILLGLLAEPVPESRDGRERDELGEVGQVLADLLDDLFDEETAEGDPGQPVQRVVDRIERCGVRFRRAQCRAGLQQRGDGLGHATHQGDLHEDERHIPGGRVKEGVDTAVLGPQSTAELGPARHRVDLLVAQQMPVQLLRRIPGDLGHAKETPVEPRGEQMVEVVVEGPQLRVTADQPTQVRAHLDQGESGVRCVVHPAE